MTNLQFLIENIVVLDISPSYNNFSSLQQRSNVNNEPVLKGWLCVFTILILYTLIKYYGLIYYIYIMIIIYLVP